MYCFYGNASLPGPTLGDLTLILVESVMFPSSSLGGHDKAEELLLLWESSLLSCSSQDKSGKSACRYSFWGSRDACAAGDDPRGSEHYREGCSTQGDLPKGSSIKLLPRAVVEKCHPLIHRPYMNREGQQKKG